MAGELSGHLTGLFVDDGIACVDSKTALFVTIVLHNGASEFGTFSFGLGSEEEGSAKDCGGEFHFVVVVLLFNC